MSEQVPIQSQDELEAQAVDAAQRVVDGEETINNPDYLEHHPNAIQDKDKALVVAHAAKQKEEAVVTTLKKAKQFSEISAFGANSDEDRGRINEIGAHGRANRIENLSDAARSLSDHTLNDAKNLRREADRLQDKAAADYDSHQEFLASDPDRLARGETMPEDQQPQDDQTGDSKQLAQIQ